MRLSPATCGRGLKLCWKSPNASNQEVARHVRAWIETLAWAWTCTRAIVARHVRAWIETSILV